MQIPSEYLEVKNYDGSRLIEIEDETVSKLHAEKVAILEAEKKPILDEMEKLEPSLDAFYKKLQPLEKERDELKKEMKPLSDQYTEHVAKIEIVQQKVDLIDSKINTIVNDMVKPQLGEFETAMTMHVKEGKFSVEVVDEIEEKVKAIRQLKK